LAGCYNVGPNSDDIVTTKSIVNRFSSYWGKELRVEAISDNSMKEAAVLRLDNTKLKTAMSLSPMWGIDDAIAMTVEWTKV
jgi:CDP-glucose 4,6-dehydratase